MSSLKEQITAVERRIEQLKLQVQQQRAHIECLHCEGYPVERERAALDAMIAELALKERYRLSLLQEVAFVGEKRNRAS
jgi:cell division protein FtsB